MRATRRKPIEGADPLLYPDAAGLDLDGDTKSLPVFQWSGPLARAVEEIESGNLGSGDPLLDGDYFEADPDWSPDEGDFSEEQAAEPGPGEQGFLDEEDW